jgi:hypothetical protein
LFQGEVFPVLKNISRLGITCLLLFFIVNK